jgi:ankyrin repeat protein
MKHLRSPVFLAALFLLTQVAAQPGPVVPKYNDVMTPVVFADLAGVRQVLSLGKWPDKPDSHGRTPLLVALKLGYPEIARALLEAGADPERSLVAARRVDDRPMVALLESQVAAAGGSTGPKSQ